MIEIRRTRLPVSDLLQSSDYASLIEPAFRAELLSNPARWIAAEAHTEGQLAALALAELYPLNRLAKLKSLIIKENFKGKGIWRALFTFMEKTLRHEEKMRGLEWNYDADSPDAFAIEKILESLGWPQPQVHLVRLHFDALAFNPPWINRRFPLPAEWHFFSWKNLNPDERDKIDYLALQGRFLPHLSPLYKEEEIDLETSVGLRQKEELVGWSITRRPNPLTLIYSSLYIDSSFHHSGYGIQLLIESMRRQKALAIPHALFEVILQEIEPSWQHFVNKRLLPLSKKVERIKRTFRVFHENLGDPSL